MDFSSQKGKMMISLTGISILVYLMSYGESTMSTIVNAGEVSNVTEISLKVGSGLKIKCVVMFYAVER